MNKKWIATLAAFTLLTALAGCGTPAMAGEAPSASQKAAEAANTTGGTTILLNGSTASVQGAGATASGSTVTVTQAGIYRLSGALADGQIVVDADKTAAVTLVLDGVDIACSTGPGIYEKQAEELVIVLAENSINSVQDGTSYTLAAGEDEPNAAVFAKDDLTITGTGALAVTGSYENGILSKDDLLVESGTITVTAKNDALRGRDSVTVLDGALTLTAGADGIQSNNDTDAEKGWVTLQGGTFDITAGNDGVQAKTALAVSGGIFQIVTGGGSANAPAHVQSFGGGRGAPGQTAQEIAEDEIAEETETGESQKGLKAGTALTISGGTFHIDSVDDSVHANGALTVMGGTFTVSTGDDGFHADGLLGISDGAITIVTSYEGLEGGDVEIAGGEITLTASDDGVNAAGGGNTLRITGGSLTVNASGDGLDANGDLLLEGGAVVVNGPMSTGNSALDYDGTCTVTGGTLVASGSTGMAQAPGSASTQPILMVYFASTQAAGTTVTLADSTGTQVLTTAPQKEFQSMILSTAQLKQGEAYTLAANGETLTQVTLAEIVTRISSDGSAAPAAMAGGRGGMGGAGRAAMGAQTGTAALDA